jgi:predicted ATP-binding protein involved in virulence
MTLLRLDKLSLTNFRCFGRCEIDFHEHLTVLVAENGCGKTAVLGSGLIDHSQKMTVAARAIAERNVVALRS